MGSGTHRSRRNGRPFGISRKRDEPQGRQQVATHLHTGTGANPQGGAKPRRGNEIPAGDTERSFTAAEEVAPSRGAQVSACDSPGGLAKDRTEVSDSAARFGAFRSKLRRE